MRERDGNSEAGGRRRASSHAPKAGNGAGADRGSRAGPDAAEAPIGMERGDCRKDERQECRPAAIMSGTASNTGSRGASPRSRTAIGAEPRSSSVETAARAAVGEEVDSSAAIVAIAPVWPMTPSRIAACEQIAGKGLQESRERRFKRHAMRAGRQRRPRRIGAVDGQSAPAPDAARRGGRRDGRPRLAASFRDGARASRRAPRRGRRFARDRRRPERGAMPRRTARRRSSRSRCAAAPRASPAGLRVGEQPIMRRPFEAVTVGEAADRESWRQPGLQLDEASRGKRVTRRAGALQAHGRCVVTAWSWDGHGRGRAGRGRDRP